MEDSVILRDSFNGILQNKHSQLSGLLCTSLKMVGKTDNKQGRGAGCVKTVEMNVELKTKIIAIETPRILEFFIKNGKTFFWLGKGSYSIDPVAKKIWNTKTGKPVLVDKKGRITITDDNDNRKVYTARYMFDELLRYV